MNSLYHRTPILSPSLRRVGIAESPHPRGGVAAALMFEHDAPGGETWPIRYPTTEQTGVPLEFVGETPNPVPRNGRSGYPITLNFPVAAKIRRVEAHLFDAQGAELPLYVSHPGRPAQSFPQGGAVCLLPKTALQPGVRHRVRGCGARLRGDARRRSGWATWSR